MQASRASRRLRLRERASGYRQRLLHQPLEGKQQRLDGDPTSGPLGATCTPTGLRCSRRGHPSFGRGREYGRSTLAHVVLDLCRTLDCGNRTYTWAGSSNPLLARGNLGRLPRPSFALPAGRWQAVHPAFLSARARAPLQSRNCSDNSSLQSKSTP